ncbi:MAG: hypothetical protein K0R39_856 [Symbiobacteriaceae bacterium]|nr:hypothetical protein [Symbiobacteriaceae bacterium]
MPPDPALFIMLDAVGIAQEAGDLYVKPRLLCKFADDGTFDGLAQFDTAAGQAPAADEGRPFALHQQYALVTPDEGVA